MVDETPRSEEQEDPGTVPPDDSEVDPGSGSPVPEREKREDTPGDADDALPAPTPGM
jgi:hypothetical protein